MQEITENRKNDGSDNKGPRNDQSVEIILDGNPVTSPTRKNTGRGIRELGPQDRVDGFETQEVNEQGKKIRTIGDNEEVELHKGERFRTVPNFGGPGAAY